MQPTAGRAVALVFETYKPVPRARSAPSEAAVSTRDYWDGVSRIAPVNIGWPYAHTAICDPSFAAL